MSDELKGKTEYSVLQSFEFKYRDEVNDQPYLVFKNALKTGLVVVAFPVKGKATGYVMILAQSDDDPKVKVVPAADFLVTREAYEAVKAATVMSKEVDQFISARIE